MIISNTSANFGIVSTLNYKHLSKINKKVPDKNKLDVVTILLYTKPYLYKSYLSFFKNTFFLINEDKKNMHSVDISLFMSLLSVRFLKILPLILICKLIYKYKGLGFSLTLLSTMSRPQYYLNILRYDFMILQPRGGASTAKEFLRDGGCVICKKNSPNSILIKKYLKNDFIESYGEMNTVKRVLTKDKESTKMIEERKKYRRENIKSQGGIDKLTYLFYARLYHPKDNYFKTIVFSDEL